MEDVLIMHLIAKTNTDSRCGLAGVVATACSWAELHVARNELVRPHIVNERYAFAREQAMLCCTVRRI